VISDDKKGNVFRQGKTKKIFSRTREILQEIRNIPKKVWDIFALTVANMGTCWLSPKNVTKQGKK
jgi:hypothetical protein